MIFYDFEVFKYDWLVVLVDAHTQSEKVIVNDAEELIAFYNEHQYDIWTGYNSNNYDRYILKGILCGFDPYEISNHIIVQDKKGWEFSSEFNRVKLISFDTQYSKLLSLKQLEAFMGHDIRETTVPFDLDRRLTADEIEETIYYCKHDVYETIEVFIEKITEFNAQLALVKEFKLPIQYVGKTQAQLASVILEARAKDHTDEYDVFIPENFIISKYRDVVHYFLNLNEQSKELTMDISGVPHTFAAGGVHGAIKNYQYECKSDELMIMADVDQLYPTIMIEYDLLSRNVANKKKFKFILSESLRLKAEKKKKEREPYKRICNITYGAEGDRYNAMYDPRNRLLVCIYGQLAILDLIEKLETIPSYELIQSNTDGILVKIKRKHFDQFDDIVYEWEERTRLHMSFDYCRKLIQKDVNNYILIDSEGGIKSKGAYVKELSKLDYDLPIVNKAIKDYFIHGVHPSDTILNVDKLIEFQKVVKITSKYSGVQFGKRKQTGKVFRVFASKTGKPLRKIKGTVVEKIAYVPDRCEIINSDITDASVPEWLDKSWYIDLAEKRIESFTGD